MKKALLTIIIFVLVLVVSAQNIVDKTGLLPGKYGVGFKLIEYADYSRSALNSPLLKDFSSENNSRSIRMYMWYPSNIANKKHNILKDFFLKSVEDFGRIKDESLLENMVFNSPQFNRISKSKIKIILEQECISIDNAEVAEGKFPVIIVGQGYNYESPISHLILCEYLASHGYIVVTSPLLGTYSKAVELNMIDFETQVRDMEFLLSKVFELPNANHEKIAALGFDLGAMSATLLQMRNANIKSLVCYDGGIMFEHNTSRLLNPSPYYDPQKLNVPALIFSRTIKNNIEMGLKEDSIIFLNSPYSKKFLVRTEDMKHKFYTSYPSLGIESILSPEPALKAYPIICEYTLNFFNCYLNGDQSGLGFLRADSKKFNEQGVNITVEEMDSKSAPISSELLEYVILKHGINEGIVAYKKSKEQKINIAEDELNALGYLLLYNYSRADEALAIFELIISEYPKSANAYDSLGEAYLFVRDLKQALVNYKKSLELDPENNNAKRIISQLEKLNIN